MFTFALFLFAAVSAVQGGAKRVSDSPRTPSVLGGGKISRANRVLFQSDAADFATTTLLQTAPEPKESYSLLLDDKYERCYENDDVGQGLSCNTCWAFSIQKMMQARLCKHNTDRESNNQTVFYSLSPLNLICHLQSSVDDVTICEAKDIFEAFEFAKKNGILLGSWVSNWKAEVASQESQAAEREERARIRAVHELAGTASLPEDSLDDEANLGKLTRKHPHFGRGTTFRKVTDDVSLLARNMADMYVDSMADVSKPTKARCKRVFDSSEYEKNLVRAPNVRFSAPPFTRDMLKRRLAFGPVVAIMRLSWEFILFTGSLFNPSGTQTFCRMARASDANDYCDPAKRDGWDEEQRSQQAKPAGMSHGDWADTWYNHFITLHGWGVKKSADGTNADVPYWVVENSWGRIYDNDASTGNNGAGKLYRADHFYGADRDKKHLIGKNHFVLIADRVAGSGELEFISREVFSISF